MMIDGVEVLDRPLKAGNGHGGARRNSGGDRSGYVKTDEVVDYDKARARHEAAKADKAELDFKIQAGEYVPRAAYKQAAATLIATFAQTIRSLPDNMERRHGLAPEIAEAIGTDLDKAMQTLAEGLQMLCDG